MSTSAKFFFQGDSSQFTKALSQVKKSMKQVATQTVALQAGLKLLSATVNTVAKTLTKVLGAALKGVVNLVKSALNTIKNIIVGAFKFIKTALTTLLSWITKALGKVFDWIGSTVKKLFSTISTIASSAVRVAKKAIKEIIDDVQAYADKEYNQIQLKVSLGDSYEAVFKDFQKLVKYTTADRNDLLSVYSTFAELGKSPEDVVKYARATVYLSNATGRSLSQITRLLLGQEAAGRDLQKVLGRIGITLTGNEESISNVEKIIAQLDDEMNALANGSLNQIFANVKNDIQAIKENIGYIFSGPVRYVAQKIEGILDKIANSNKIEGLANKLNAWFKGIEPFIDKIFDMVERIMRDPEGFLKALWSDIQTIFGNIKKNFWNYLNVLSYIIGEGVEKLGETIKGIDWSGVKESFNYVGSQLKEFVFAFGKGIGWWTQEDIDKAGGSFKNMFINAWNDAHPNFELHAEDEWYKNLFTLINGVWTDVLKPAWDTIIKPDVIDPFIEWVKGPFCTVMGTIFEWLGEVLYGTFQNLLLRSDTLRKIMSAIGMPIATTGDQQAVYEAYKDLLPQTITVGHVWRDLRPEDITSEFLNSKYDGDAYFHGTWGKYLEQMGFVTGDALNSLRRIGRADEITEEVIVPTIQDLANSIQERLNPTEHIETSLNNTEATLIKVQTSTEDTASAVTDIAKTISHGGSGFSVGTTGTGFGGGGIADLFGDELRIKPYAKGGLVTKPTVALIGEAGPELIIPAKSLPMLANADAERYNIGTNITVTKTSLFEEAVDALGLIDEDLNIITKDTSELYKFFTSPQTYARTTGGGGINNPNNMYLDENGVWREKKFQTWVDTSKVGKILIKMGTFLVKFSEKFTTIFTNISDFFKDFKNMKWYQIGDRLIDVFEFIPKLGLGLLGSMTGGNGVNAFGSHIGNIYTNSFDDDGKFSILQMFGAIIQELLPYLQKGLDIIAPLFDEAFEILGNAVQILGERIGNELLPILEAFVPFMKTFADVVIALAPVVESILRPAIMIIATILQLLTGILDKLMPVFAGLGAVIQWICDSISYAVASVINWLASWIPWVSSVEAKKPNSVKGYYNDIMGTYNASKANTVSTPTTSSAGVASQTASYNGATTVYMTNDFSGAYVIGNNGFRELALIIRRTLEDADYAGQSI